MNIIYYFTATGNCLHVAQALAEVLPDTKLIRITDKTVPIAGKYERIGFVFPVYVAVVPQMVKQFVENLNILKDTYIFGIAVHGGVKGRANLQIASILNLKAIHQYGLFDIKLVHNGYFISKPLSYENQIKILDKGDVKVNKIAEQVRKKNTNVKKYAQKVESFLERIMTSEKIIADPKKLSKGMKINEACIGCGVCMSVCPAGNIEIVDGKVQFSNKCEVCFACLHWCPKGTIQFDHPTLSGKSTKGKGQYHHNKIALKDIVRRK